jgi:hypothetical protein
MQSFLDKGPARQWQSPSDVMTGECGLKLFDAHGRRWTCVAAGDVLKRVGFAY